MYLHINTCMHRYMYVPASLLLGLAVAASGSCVHDINLLTVTIKETNQKSALK